LYSYSDPERFANEANSKLGESRDNILTYLKKTKELYKLTSDIFIFSSIHDFNTYKKAGMKGLKSLFKLDATRSYHKLNKSFFRSNKMIQLFDRYATYNGSNPYVAPATLKVIGHLEHNLGAYFPEGGIYSIVKSLEEAGKKMGIQYKLSTEVEKIENLKDGKNSVFFNGNYENFDAIVNATDIAYFYNNLLHEGVLPKKIRKAEPSSSAIIFYWGVNKTFPTLDLHNILFGKNYKEEFNLIFKKKILGDDPTIYIFISSKVVKTDAPENCENWFVMINTPANYGQDWDELVVHARKTIVKKINKYLQIDIDKYIVCEKVNTPVTLEQKTSSYRGAIYGSSSNSVFSAFNRHPNFKKKLKNIYFTGGSVHPGGGIPLCIASANIVSQRIKRDLV